MNKCEGILSVLMTPFNKNWKVVDATENKDLSKALKIQHDMNDVIKTLLSVCIYPALKECITFYDYSAVSCCNGTYWFKTA